METVNTSERLQGLRQLMKENKIDLYIVPSEDSHQSEYIAPCDARRAFISGFSGSAGTAVITLEKAALATDGRYFNQAAKQLDSNWTLLKQGLEDVPTWQEWTADQSEGGKTVGVDATLLTAAEAKRLAEKIKKKGGGELVGSTTNFVDTIWGKEKPERPNEKAKVHPTRYAGKDVNEKIQDVVKDLDKKKAAGLVISMLDEIAWLYNLRGNDIPFNPVFFSYAVVTPSSATLYIDDSKIDEEVKTHLGSGVHIRPYTSIFEDAKALGASVQGTPRRKFLVSSKASWALSLALGGEDNVENIRSPIGDSKAIKNDTELEGMRQCHIRDGAALTEYFAWLENELVTKKTKLDEVEAADKLEALRKAQEHFVGLSFPTISSTGANAAVIHYQPEAGNCSVIDPAAIYLCDSGAQYLDGTTDTTRTLHFSQPTEMEKKAYTLVLKGVIAIDQATFPKGTNGLQLDVLARVALWKEGLDFRHGTGHGVGSYLNVHEGPIGIGTRAQYTEVALSPGNAISDEPGYYEDGKFGIRIENIVLCIPKETKHKFGDKPWLGFENVTMTPLCRKLIDPDLLIQGEIEWINSYHEKIYAKTKGFFEGQDHDGKKLALSWLKRETSKM